MNQWRGWMLYCSCWAGVIYFLISSNHTNVFLVSLHEFRTEIAANGHSGLEYSNISGIVCHRIPLGGTGFSPWIPIFLSLVSSHQLECILMLNFKHCFQVTLNVILKTIQITFKFLRNFNILFEKGSSLLSQTFLVLF
jgi:hypothetical protein